MRLLAFPYSGSAYTEGFYSALNAAGQEVIEGVFAGRWILCKVRRGDVAHLHWPSFLYVTRKGKPLLIKRFARFFVLLVLLKLLGARIVWTAHNLLPHDPSLFRRLDVLARHLVIACKLQNLCTRPRSVRDTERSLSGGAKKIVIIPHGHFIGFYPDDISRDNARAHFCFAPSTFVYLFIGLCKPYKNLHGLVEVFRNRPGDIALLVAGKFQDRAYDMRRWYERLLPLTDEFTLMRDLYRMTNSNYFFALAMQLLSPITKFLPLERQFWR